MKMSRLFCAVIVFQTAAIAAQSLEARGKSDLSRHKRSATTNNSTCPIEKLKHVAGAILKRREDENKSSVTFSPGDKAEFVCKVGYRLQDGQLKSFICQQDGTWKDNVQTQSKFGFCAKSDWDPCGPTLIDVTGKASGVLTSAMIHQEPSNPSVNCTWKLVTEDPGFYIKLLFINVTMPTNCIRDYVSLENVTFTDSRQAQCCNKGQGDHICRFSGKNVPLLSRSVSNFTIVNFYSESPANSYFKAIWYNVNGFFPNGLIPAQDSNDIPLIVFATLKPMTVAPQYIPPVLALVLFTIIVFAVGFFLACKVGKRYLGPSCSFSYFCAWVSSLRTPQAPSTPRHREAPSEARGLMTDTDSPFTGERVLLRVSDRSLSSHSGDEYNASSHDSLENVVL